MDKCCRTCKHCRSGECEHEDMIIKRETIEEVIVDIFLEMKVDAKELYLREVVQGFEDAIISRLKDVNFTPPDIREFCCEHYE